MDAALQLLLVATLSGTPVTVTTLDGQSTVGELTKLDSAQVVVQTEAQDKTLPVDQLMLLRFNDAQVNETPTGGKAAKKVVRLSDQSLLTFETVIFKEKQAEVETIGYGATTVPVNAIQNIRWGAVDEKVQESWTDLQSRGARDDLLVFRKGDVLDYVAGTVSELTDKGVTINVRGRELKAPVDRIFAVVFANRSANETPGVGLLRTTEGDELKAKSITLKETTLAISLVSGINLELDLSKTREIDFGGGRIRYLADLPFDDSTSVSPNSEFPVVWFTALNFPAGSGGRRPLLIDGKQYQRGLWMHSGAIVRFRLNRQFTELRTVAGFDQTHVGKMPRFNPKVKLVFEGDSEELYAKEFSWDTPPEKINLNLSNVRELIIRVESLGVGKGILEHFALGDAQVIK